MIHPERRQESLKQIAYEEGYHAGYMQAMSEMPEILRCKDCKNYMTIHCVCDVCCISPDWFYASGVKL